MFVSNKYCRILSFGCLFVLQRIFLIIKKKPFFNSKMTNNLRIATYNVLSSQLSRESHFVNYDKSVLKVFILDYISFCGEFFFKKTLLFQNRWPKIIKQIQCEIDNGTTIFCFQELSQTYLER